MENKENQSQRKPRILCLHGFRTSAGILKSLIGKRWPVSVVGKLDLVFLDGPYPAQGKSDVEGIFDPPYYEWFQANQDFSEYTNFEECLAYIEDYMVKNGPFDGFLGFSQGAILTAALPGMQNEANTGVHKFKYVGLPDYEMCKNVFEKSHATGGLGYSSANLPCDVGEEEDIDDRFLHPSNLRSDDDDDEAAFQDYIGGQRSGSKRAGPSSGRGRGQKKRTTDADGVRACMMEVASVLRSRTDASMASQRLNSETVNNEEEFSLAACQKIVDSMGVTPTAYLKSLQYLMDNKEWRGVFGRMSMELRWSWMASLDC